jgi:class 3 adenylate cyclase/pimeloyl-ACP methyl ester carboxylesterase
VEPHIQYATAPDGVRIAFWALGAGPALVVTPITGFSHVQLEWEHEPLRDWLAALGGGRMLIRYDGRGCGLSDRAVDTFSLDDQVHDMRAVFERLGLQRVALLGMFHGGPVAIEFAARYPEQVSHLILWCSYARFADIAAAPRVEAARAIREALWQKDWDLLSELWGFLLSGTGGEEQHRWFASYMRQSADPDTLQQLYLAVRTYDVSHRLKDVAAPTLVVHRRGLKFADVGANRNIASVLPNARMILLEGDSFLPHIGDARAALDVMREFLGPGSSTPPAHAGAFRTILFTDIEEHTPLMARLGDEAGRELLREHDRITRTMLREHGGEEVKAMGDGFMASFASVTLAVQCAIALQRAFESRNDAAAEQLHIRVGLNAGEPIAEDGDYYGAAVIAASRITAHARGGEIVASNVVRELCAGKGFLFGDRGLVPLRGFDDPVRVFEIVWRQAG